MRGKTIHLRISLAKKKHESKIKYFFIMNMLNRLMTSNTEKKNSFGDTAVVL